MTERQTQKTDESNPPEIDLRDGDLRSATWRNEGKYGPFFKTRITKIYRDEDGNFREAETLSAKDLLRVSELARETHQKIVERQREHRLERDQDQSKETQPEFSEDWHDDDKSRDDIQRERFKQERQPSRGTRRPRQRSRKA